MTHCELEEKGERVILQEGVYDFNLCTDKQTKESHE